MLVRDFRELEVYALAYETAMRIFRLSKQFPREEQFGLTSQVRNSSRSVCANIAEAWRRRRYEPHFRSKLTDADTEAGETQVWLDFARDCGYLTAEAHDELFDRYVTSAGCSPSRSEGPGPGARRQRGEPNPPDPIDVPRFTRHATALYARTLHAPHTHALRTHALRTHALR